MAVPVVMVDLKNGKEMDRCMIDSSELSRGEREEREYNIIYYYCYFNLTFDL